jgi:hypothetical protein
MVTAQRSDKKEQFAKHLITLNKSFHSWLKDQVAADPCADLAEGFQVRNLCNTVLNHVLCQMVWKDYVDFACSLEDRYLRSYGEVLTFGSGDCGQLAHGIDRDEDLMVKYPRIVYSLR